MIRSSSNYSDFPMGAWAANRAKGIRNYPYSLDESVNPSTYKTLDKPGYWGVHAIGEVWAELLWVVANRLIKKHGFTDSLFPPLPNDDGSVPEGDFYRPKERDAKGHLKPLVPKHGNSLIIQCVPRPPFLACVRRTDIPRTQTRSRRHETPTLHALILRRTRRDRASGPDPHGRRELLRSVERVRGQGSGRGCECAG